VGLLSELGYTRVRDFDGGIAEWTGAGLPVEKGDTPLFVIEPPEVRPGARQDAPKRGVSPLFRSPLAWVSKRSIGALLWTWLIINLGCGVLYWLVSFVPGHGLREPSQPMGHGAAALLEAIYFSFVTGLSIGFGDIVPVGIVRVLAVIQGGACLLVFGAIISKLVSGRQEELTEEIHRIAFEDRLGRVRTNLHLVVSEIQEIATLCGDDRKAPATVQTRIESAAAVFTGELRAIHDLLYRPQEAPDEDVLESILAHLEGGLREFSHLLDCMTPEFRDAPALVANTRVLATLANEICGTCVPREYAPHLTVWMDRIQAHARGLTRHPSPARS
jgi:potassium channel LctB